MARRNLLFRETADEGRFRRPRGGTGMDLDITPMIDVTFLLLIFFMVASTMQATAETDIPPARHGVGVETGQSTVITIRLTGNAEPEIFLGDGTSRKTDLSGVTDYVRRGVENGRTRVIIKADRDVEHGFVQRAARAARAADDGIRFFIGVRDKRTG